MSTHLLLAFSATVFVASITPGPTMLLALTHGMRFGTRRTIASAFGNVAVTALQAGASLLGLGAILLASELMFQLIKWAGAAYLIYLGISFCRSSGPQLTPVASTDKEAMSLTRMFLQSALLTAGNPKAIVFFTAVFPLFIEPNADFMLQAGMLVGICTSIAFGCFMIYAVAGERLVFLLRGEAVAGRIRKVFGSIFIAMGVGIAAGHR